MKYEHSYYYTEEWQAKRRLKLQWSAYKCEKCGSKYELNVHHKHYKSFKDEMPWDLIVLCKKCHDIEHYIGFPDSELVVT